MLLVGSSWKKSCVLWSNLDPLNFEINLHHRLEIKKIIYIPDFPVFVLVVVFVNSSTLQFTTQENFK